MEKWESEAIARINAQMVEFDKRAKIEKLSQFVRDLRKTQRTNPHQPIPPKSVREYMSAYLPLDLAFLEEQGIAVESIY